MKQYHQFETNIGVISQFSVEVRYVFASENKVDVGDGDKNMGDIFWIWSAELFILH